ncbi:redoxin family protein [Olivibacter sp. SDN3]|uniref:TlpA family protein disulfide reductase n=1 Tax=Olivibacter sp. SDN3 TaxID=2764720 RepID=UPI001650E877|nr:redoxin family protein [Olivibacter sp. SDN3]QNL49786.1 redoxin family protein [Olivibacter sp. SDN3]
MFKKQSVFISLVLSISCSNVLGQSLSSDIRELKVGDTIPNLTIGNTIGKNHKNLKIKNLYEKGLLIIDFWATWCKPCISELKKIDSLKINFSENFSSLAITYQDSSEVQRFLSSPSNIDINNKSSLIVSNDTTFSQYFKHRYLPHNIWIDSIGVIKAITGGEHISKGNISYFLANQDIPPDLQEKKDNLNFDFLQPFHLGDQMYKYRSIITPMIPEINSGVLVDYKDHKVNRFFAFNNRIITLYWNAYSLFQPNYKPYLIQADVKDSLRLLGPLKNNNKLLLNSKYENHELWSRDNLFCYELVLPERIQDSLFVTYMFQDLDRFFGYKTEIVEKKIQCIVLKGNASKLKKMRSKMPEKHTYSPIRIEYPKLIAENITTKDLAKFLMGSFKNLNEPIVDESDYPYYFDLEIDFSQDLGIDIGKNGIDLEIIMKRLENLGFSFNKKIKPYPILVISDK